MTNGDVAEHRDRRVRQLPDLTGAQVVELEDAGLVFFADGGNGDQFFLSLSGSNEIYVWDHESDSRTWVAPTVLGYLERGCPVS